MWNMITGLFPGWGVLFQGLMIFAVPVALTRLMNLIRVKEGQISTRGVRAEGRKGGGVPSDGESGGSVSGSKEATTAEGATEANQTVHSTTYSGVFQEDLRKFKGISADMEDVNVRELRIGALQIKAAVLFVDGLTDKDVMDRNILKPLMNAALPFEGMTSVPEAKLLKDIIVQQIVLVSEIEYTTNLRMSLQKVLFGSAVLLVEGLAEVIVLGTPKGRTRGGEEPISEALLRGPRVGFNETLSDNTAMLRRHGQNTELAMISFTVGKRIEKELVLTYIRDIANKELIEEIKRRIHTIDIDDVLESGYVEQLIEDNYLSPFQQLQNTERPDRVMAALLEGRAAILLDGTPFALIMPVTFGMLLQSPEDYYDRWFAGSLLRILRFFAAVVSLFAPALYISFLSFNPGMIPTKLVISIIGSRQGVPFPTLIEALIMEISIEILREAGLRLPKPIGPAMGIVGGLIIGQAAVEAGIVSPILVIVVAVTAISSFAMPMYSAGITLRYLRFAAMFFAALFGLYGVVLFFLLLSSHLIKLKSFGVPYISLTVPYRMRDWKDFVVRVPLQFMKRRPALLKPKGPIRKG
ncbi:spore germination protein [Paenibacillus sp. 19GGS1-52]|uniref:spore germination protein n=1 Tax=Paenibacillus sp. 19GGS1-52 TaxID=2758563 RepID=UPI001EFA4CB7|nr:spore germination protein [Paenibacillus sp. 19GGS1-52]ULO07027.1 spore germination protein [Paenibacillus sp. 19GGS1-52]